MVSPHARLMFRTRSLDTKRLKLKTPWRDGATHLVISPLEFKRLRVELPLCGYQIYWCYVSNGSNG